MRSMPMKNVMGGLIDSDYLAAICLSSSEAACGGLGVNGRSGTTAAVLADARYFAEKVVAKPDCDMTSTETAVTLAAPARREV